MYRYKTAAKLYAAGIRGHHSTNLQIVLNTQKNPYLSQAIQKITCQIVQSKKSIDHPRHLKSEALQAFHCFQF